MDNYFLLVNFNLKKGAIEFQKSEKIESLQSKIKQCYAGLSTLDEEELKEIITQQFKEILKEIKKPLKD